MGGRIRDQNYLFLQLKGFTLHDTVHFSIITSVNVFGRRSPLYGGPADFEKIWKPVSIFFSK